MSIPDTVAVVTGAAGTLGRGIAIELAQRGVHGLAVVDSDDAVSEIAQFINRLAGDCICWPYRGQPADEVFRRRVYTETAERCGLVNVCVPAVDGSRTNMNRFSGPGDLLVGIAWALEMVHGIAAFSAGWAAAAGPRPHRVNGMVFFTTLASPVHGDGNPACTDEVRRACTALMTRADAVGVRCAVMLPDQSSLALVKEPGARTGGVVLETSLDSNALAKAICFLITSGGN